MAQDDPLNFVRIARQLERERSAAKPIVEQLSTTIGEQWDLPIPATWRTAGFVQELTIAAAGMLEQNARTSMSLARFALAIVGSIPEKSYASPVLVSAEAAAWKELANGHRYLSEYDPAIRALDAADRCLQRALSLSYDRAVVGLARALVLCDMRRFDDARALVQESANVFQDYKDHRRTGQCFLLEGMIEQRRGQLVDACNTYARAIEALRQTDDLHSLAAVHKNLAQARTDLGQTAAAVSALHDSLAIFTDLGETGEVVRTKWVLGRLLLTTGKHQQARDLLLEVRSTFRGLGMIEEAGLAGLDLVEAYLALGASDQAGAVVEEVLAEFQRAQLNERSATALAYLRDIVTTPRGTDAVRHVRDYVEKLKDRRALLFAPLPD